jgi:hypothetical protein
VSNGDLDTLPRFAGRQPVKRESTLAAITSAQRFLELFFAAACLDMRRAGGAATGRSGANRRRRAGAAGRFRRVCACPLPAAGRACRCRAARSFGNISRRLPAAGPGHSHSAL